MVTCKMAWSNESVPHMMATPSTKPTTAIDMIIIPEIKLLCKFIIVYNNATQFIYNFQNVWGICHY